MAKERHDLTVQFRSPWLSYSAIGAESNPRQVYVGGPDDETFISGFFVADDIDGGGGTDTVDYRTNGNSVSVYLALDDIEWGAGPDGDRLIRIENVITGGGNDFVRGSYDANRIETGAGSDYLWGYGGADTLIGGTGDDTYVSVLGNETIIENADEGTDRVQVLAANYTMPENVENLEPTGGAPQNRIFIGNSLNNTIGGGGADDQLYGMGGNDVLDGQFGLDILYGGPGDDVFLVGTGAQVVELSGEGTDLVSTSGANYTLSDHVENLWSSGSATGQSLTGNALANSIRGSDVADVLSGLDGDDLLEGFAGNDTLYGDDGNDTLIGGTGSNSLYGGAGDDLLQIRVGSSDTVLDGGDGFDTLWVRTSTTLTANLASIERVQFDTVNVTLTMTSLQAAGLSSNADFTAHGTGVGRIVINMTPSVQLIATQFTLSSDIVAFTINGTTSIDVIKGPLTAAMTVSAGDGTDQIRTGNLVDTIDGGAGNDKIMGLGGADVLTGGTGSDQFRYLFTTDSGLGTGADRILDFTNGQDKLDFRALDADPVLAGRQALNFIGNAAFASNGSAQVRHVDAGADTRVEVDLNGDGAADMHILLVGHAGQALSGTEFLL